MRVRRLLPLLAIPLLAGCVMPRPWNIQKVPKCDDSAGLPTEATLFLTIRLPDCGKGVLTRYRGPLRYAAASGKGRARLVDKTHWFEALESRVAETGNKPVIFIHGFNNTNPEVIERAELVARALGGRRVVIAFTWPSYGKKTGYVWDEANAEWALEPASAAIREITAKYPGAIILAHSMGSRIALRTIADLKADGRLGEVSRLILAAPDVDRAELVTAWGQAGPPLLVTMYVSRRDQALSLSWRTHAQPRAGDLSYWVTGRQPYYVFQYVKSGLEVIDTTEVDSTILGHAAFVEVAAGAIDLCRVIEGAPLGRAVAPLAENYVRLTGNGPDDACRRNVPKHWPKAQR